MKDDIAFYISVFVRKFHYFVMIFGLFAAASLTAAQLLPPVYVASSRLLVEASQIPTNLAVTTIQTAAEEELQILEQRLMTRVNILNIARDLDVFVDIDKMSADNIVKSMRKNTTIQRSTGRGQATLLNIYFSASTGIVAADVVNRYVTIILQDNAQNRASQAGNTLEFFEDEVERLGKELERQNSVILVFNNENSDALPETLDYRLSQHSTLQTRLATTEKEISLLNNQKRRLVEIFEMTGSLGASQSVSMSPEQRRLAELKEELQIALSIYSAENPKVKLLEIQVASQESIVNIQAGVSNGEEASLTTILDVQLTEIDSRLDILIDQRDLNMSQLTELQDSIDRTPAVTITLASFDREYQNVQTQYNRAVDGMSKAATGERIELSDQGHRIDVIDPATVPSSPDSPNRKLIAVGGSFLGVFMGFAIIFGLEFLNSSIRRASDITRSLGVTPIVTVPYIRTPLELVMRRAAIFSAFILVLIGFPAALIAVHTYYLPLDMILDRFSDKIGSFL